MIRRIAHQIARPFAWLARVLFDDYLAIITLLVIALLIVAVLGVFISDTTPKERSNTIEQQRYFDTEAGVVCWWLNKGLSCLPISETNLRIPE